MGMQQAQNNQAAQTVSDMKFALATARAGGSALADDASSVSESTLYLLAEKKLAETQSTDQ